MLTIAKNILLTKNLSHGCAGGANVQVLETEYSKKTGSSESRDREKEWIP